MLYRPLLTLISASTLMALLVCGALVFAAKRSHDRFEAASAQLAMLEELEDSAREVVQAALADDGGNLESAVTRLTRSRDAVDAGAADQFGELFAIRGDAVTPQAQRRRVVLEALLRDARVEWWLTLALVSLLAAATLALAWQLHRHVLTPLDTLNRLLTTMARRRYELADPTGINPALRGLFESYNDLVRRVSESEDVQAQRENELRRKIRSATRALMQQHMALSREERLAATGELAAQVAHDMRNPLAGILAAVENLRREIEDTDHQERLELIREEIRRLGRQLDGLVDASRQRPEPSKALAVCDLADSLLSLASYQLPPGIELGCSVPPELVLNVPEGGLRQALLNLVLNASHAIGEGTGRIEIVSATDAEHVSVAVRDSGPGFSQEILDAGVRAFGASATGGTGLGLAAARRFVSDLGGELAIANLEHGGAEVSLKFPVRLSHA